MNKLPSLSTFTPQQKNLTASLAVLSLLLISAFVLFGQLSKTFSEHSRSLTFKAKAYDLNRAIRDYALIGHLDTKKEEVSQTQLQSLREEIETSLASMRSDQGLDQQERLFVAKMEQIWANTLEEPFSVYGQDSREFSLMETLIGEHENAKIEVSEPRLISLLTTSLALIGACAFFFLIVMGYSIWTIVHENRSRTLLLEELRLARDQALLASDMKTKFIATISHEMRTPLNGVLGLSELLYRRTSDPESRHQIGLIQSSGQTLLRIINDILEFSKAGHQALTSLPIPFSIREVVSQVVETLGSRAAEKGLSLKVHFEGSLPATVSSDPDRLAQILFNIVGNAIKFTEVGKIDVTVKVDLHEDHKQGLLLIDVSDSGIGIPEASLSSIFEPFSKLQRPGTSGEPGTGLGLSHSQQLMRSLGGDLRIESLERLGTKVSLSIPIQLGSALASTQEQTSAAAGANEIRSNLPRDTFRLPHQILVVEDNSANQLIVVEMLKLVGAQVDLASDGSEALAAIKKQSYDLILMDCQMPVMDGYEASRAIRRLGCATPILALTASALDDEHQRCLLSGMNGVITKPVSMTTLHKEITKILEDEAPAWSPAYHERLTRQLGPEASSRVQQVFLSSLESASKELSRARKAGDREALAKLAHKLRSSALTCGANRLGLFCDSITNSKLDLNDQDFEALTRTFEHHLTETINGSPIALPLQQDPMDKKIVSS